MRSSLRRKVTSSVPLAFYAVTNVVSSALVATAFVLINTELGSELDAVRSIKNIPGVTEAYLVYGTYDIIVKIQGDSLDKVKQTITQSLRTMSNVRSTLSMVVVEG